MINKIEKIQNEIERLESEINVLNSNRKKTNRPSTIREIDAKIHAKQKEIEAHKELMASLKKEAKQMATIEKEIVASIENVEENVTAEEEIKEEAIQQEKPKSKVAEMEENLETLKIEISTLKQEIEDLKVHKMRIRHATTLADIQERIYAKQLLLNQKEQEFTKKSIYLNKLQQEKGMDL